MSEDVKDMIAEAQYKLSAIVSTIVYSTTYDDERKE